MTWFTITHACGHEERHRLDGDRRRKEWLCDQRAAEPCTECKAEERAKASREAAEAAAAAGLPSLTGSEKQIAWAETIRQGKLDIIARAMAETLSYGEAVAFFGTDLPPTDPAFPAGFAALRAEARAHWWIDNRQVRASGLVLAKLKAGAAAAPVAEDPAVLAAEAAALAEATIRPETEVTATPCEVRVADNGWVTLHFPERRDAFSHAIGRLQFDWSRERQQWERRIQPEAGTPADRAAEAAATVLALGIPVRIADPAVRAKTLEGDYEPEQRLWITRVDERRVRVTWPREVDHYVAAKRLPGARYCPPGIVVPTGAFAAIQDFATAYGYSFSATAQAALDTAREAHEAALIAKPKRARKCKPPPGPMPAVSDDIAPSLRDD